MSSNCFDLHFSNPHVYRVSSKALYTNIKQDEVNTKYLNWSISFFRAMSNCKKCGKYILGL